MKFISSKLRNKRGIFYNSRDNKTANGFSKNAKNKSAVSITLAVRGTTDHLAQTNFYFKLTSIEHPTDKGYFKQAYKLTKQGKQRLISMKILKNMGLPLWGYMYNVDTNCNKL